MKEQTINIGNGYIRCESAEVVDFLIDLHDDDRLFEYISFLIAKDFKERKSQTKGEGVKVPPPQFEEFSEQFKKMMLELEKVSSNVQLIEKKFDTIKSLPQSSSTETVEKEEPKKLVKPHKTYTEEEKAKRTKKLKSKGGSQADFLNAVGMMQGFQF